MQERLNFGNEAGVDLFFFQEIAEGKRADSLLLQENVSLNLLLREQVGG